MWSLNHVTWLKYAAYIVRLNAWPLALETESVGFSTRTCKNHKSIHQELYAPKTENTRKANIAPIISTK